LNKDSLLTYFTDLKQLAEKEAEEYKDLEWLNEYFKGYAKALAHVIEHDSGRTSILPKRNENVSEQNRRPGRIKIPGDMKGGTMLKKNVIELYVEQCNCGMQVRHNNGGNYHAVDKLNLIGDENGVYCVILERTTTREEFTGDQHVFLAFQGGEFRLEDEERVMEMYPVRFRQGEAEIIWQNSSAFIETRKPRAEELAATARAFGHEASWEEFLMDA